MGSLADGDGEKVQDVLVPWVVKAGGKAGEKKGKKVNDLEGGGGKEDSSKEGAEPKEDTVYHRYYHLFVKGELRELVETAAREDGFALGNEERTGEKWLRIIDEGWEADNWWIEGEVGASQ